MLSVPDLNLPVRLHTYASDLAAGVELTQSVENREAPLGYANHRLTRTEEKLSFNDRDILGVLYGIEQFHTYLQLRRFPLGTDCAALAWLFTSQNLSSKMHRWSLRSMQFDIDLKWRKGEDHAAPDERSRLRRKGPPEPPIDTSFPYDTSSAVDIQCPAGLALDGVPLRTLSPLSAAEQKVLDGVSLAALGLADVRFQQEMPLHVFYALQITPEPPASDDHYHLQIYEDARIPLAPRLP